MNNIIALHTFDDAKEVFFIPSVAMVDPPLEKVWEVIEDLQNITSELIEYATRSI